jgi:hypothetical protein
MTHAANLRTTLGKQGVPFHIDAVAEDEHPWERRESDPAATRDRMKSGPGAGRIQTQERYQIYQYLHSMPRCTEVMERERGDRDGAVGDTRPLDSTIVIAIHHIDGKAYGALSVLREWGATDMATVFVGYNPLMEDIYRPELDEIPDDKLTTCIIQAIHESDEELFAEGTYEIVATFNKFPEGQAIPSDAFNEAFKSKGPGGGRMDFLQAMQSLTVYTLLHTLARAHRENKKVMVFEDGGYLHPIVNQALFGDWTVADLRKKFAVPPDDAADATLPKTMKESLSVFTGSTEYTRNGYNRSADIQEERGHLMSPLFSIACSNAKTQFEGDGIALACLMAITTVLYAAGDSLRLRNVLVMGARGSIGRRFLQHVATILDEPEKQLLGCDLKVDWPKSARGSRPDWSTAPDVPNKPCLAEASAFKKFDKRHVRGLDVIFGVTGGPTVDHATVEGDDIEDWLAHGSRSRLYMASGSTKTSEYTNVLGWINAMLEKTGNREVCGRKVLRITPGPIDDQLSDAAVQQMEVAWEEAGTMRKPPEGSKLSIKRNFGTQFVFEIEADGEAGTTEEKTIYLLNNTMPVNFMFYGTPAEILDYSYAQLLDVTAKLGIRAKELTEARVYATDYSLAATEGVWNATGIAKDYPVPLSSGKPLPGGE